MRVRYSPRATRDLNSIYEYLAERTPRGAASVMAAVLAAIEFIKRHPEAAPAVSNTSGIRGIIVRRYRFRIFYRVLLTEGFVEIVHVRHTSRRPWLGEDH
jgi:addiction module RelE/StbE family toxin